jgi:hypothetical protein
MRDKNLRRLGPGFYVDDRNLLYFDVREFLTIHHLPDRIEVRRAVWEEVRRDFGAIGISSIFPTEEEQ